MIDVFLIYTSLIGKCISPFLNFSRPISYVFFKKFYLGLFSFEFIIFVVIWMYNAVFRVYIL